MFDSDTEQLMRDIEQGLSEAKAGTYAVVHTPAQINSRRGRPIGSTKPNAKVSINIRFDPDVLAALRATGHGWQTRVNDTMRRSVRRMPVAA